MVKEIVWYQTAARECPAKLFVDSLAGPAAKKVAWVLKVARVQAFAPAVYFCKMPGTDGIWEFRATFSSNAYRILAFMDEYRVVLTNGFIKKTWKTPRSEIERAERFQRDYFERKGRGEAHG